MANRLAHETSPYLQQHAENPVDWYPWGEEALALARTQDRPILLSVGYSACHWCHVMAHESFEDPEVAVEMNRHFVNIKVDREERPDLDHIYQTAHHLLTRRAGGWPLTLFLMPDGTPFFAGTYFPKTARYGMPGFRDLLGRIAAAYRDQRDALAVQNASLMEAFANAAPAPTAEVVFDRAPVDEAVRDLAEVFDRVHGGIGSAPKFPHPFELAFCLRRQALEGDTAAGEIARLTLSKMAEGGINDQLGGGFCRYSTDPYWSIPHFEKMLYDNGPLLGLYVDAWRVTRDPLFEKTVRETAAWVLREMQAPIHPGSGGYYSSLDADSEGIEGKFYVWSREAVQALLSAEEYAVAAAHFGLDAAPNFESRHWNLRVSKPLADVAAARGLTLDACRAHLDGARDKLFAARAQRVRPGRDEKVLTSWNALMITAMARAGRVFGRDDWIASARGALEFLRERLWKDGRLLATFKDDRAHLNAYLDDHAFLLDALLEVMQTGFRSDDLLWAQDVADLLLDQFEDREHGGFYFVSHDHERLIHRPKVGHDNATPSGNGVAAFALQRLGHLVGEPRYVEAAGRAIRFFYESLARNPSGYTTLLSALEEALSPPRIVVLRGPPDVLAQWQAHLAATYRPDTLIVALPEDASGLPAALDKPPHPTAAAWVCEGVACLPPVFDIARVESLITPDAAPH